MFLKLRGKPEPKPEDKHPLCRGRDFLPLWEDVQDYLEIEPPEGELADCECFEDLLALVETHLPEPNEAPVRCATAVAYHRLKRAIQPLCPEKTLAPDADLTEIDANRTVSRAWDHLERATGLQLPMPPVAPAAKALGYLLLLAPFPLFIWWPWWIAVITGPIALMSATFVWGRGPQRLPESCTTLRSMARAAAGLNYPRLVEACGGSRAEDLHRAVEVVHREYLAREDAW